MGGYRAVWSLVLIGVCLAVATPHGGQAAACAALEGAAVVNSRGDYFGQIASPYAPDSIFNRYGRLVSRIDRDGVDLSVALLQAGLAWHYTQYSDEAKLAASEAWARSEEKGLWRQDAPVAPWLFRRRAE